MATEAFTLRAETDIVHKLDDLAGSRNYEDLETPAWQVERFRRKFLSISVEKYPPNSIE